MPQVLKEEVQKRIVDASLRVFAKKGYGAATIGEIAAAAGISTGNVYRYYENKEALFEGAVDEQFVGAFSRLLQERVRALGGVADIGALEPGAAWFTASEELMRFTLENRLRLVVLLGRAEGTRWASFAGEMVEELVRLAVAHFRALGTGMKVTETTRFALARIYENLVSTTARILDEYEDEALIREAVASYTRYHLAGLRALFEGHAP